MTTPIEIDDARWRRLCEADALGEPLSDDERAFLEQHEPDDPVVRGERDLVEALGLYGGGSDRSDDDEAIVAAVVDRHFAEPLPDEGMDDRVVALPRRTPWALVAAAGLLAAGLVGLWVLEPAAITAQGGSAPSSEDGVASAVTTPTLPPARPGVTDEPVDDPAAPPVTIALRSGTVQDEAGRTFADGETPALGTVLTVGAARACLGHGGSRACFDPGSRLRVHEDEHEVRVEAVEGRAELELSAADVTTSVFVVQVAGASYRATSNAEVTVQIDAQRRYTIEVEAGELAGTDGERLSAGEVRRGGDDSKLDPKLDPKLRRPGGPGLDASTLLAQARAARSRGDRRAAIAAYEALLDQHPRAPAAAPAMVTLGQLYLDAGKAKPALGVFSRYLRTGGPLAEEAAYGRIRALGKLGRRSQQEDAIRRFLSDYPSSTYAGTLRQRLGP